MSQVGCQGALGGAFLACLRGALAQYRRKRPATGPRSLLGTPVTLVGDPGMPREGLALAHPREPEMPLRRAGTTRRASGSYPASPGGRRAVGAR